MSGHALTAHSGRGSFLGTPETAPGPTGPRMLRDLKGIRRDPLAYLDVIWRQHGDVVQFPIPRPPSYLVNDPEAVRRVLVGNARDYSKRTIQYGSLSLVTGNGLLVADGDAWRHQRRLVQPAFHHSALVRVADHIDAAVRRLTDRWLRLPAGTVVDIEAELLGVSLEVVGHALFGADLSAEARTISAATLTALDVVVARARVPMAPPSWLATPGNLTLMRSVGVLDNAVRTIVDERRRSSQPRDHPDMLDLLLATTDESGDRLSDEEVRDEIVTFIVAGHETVATALTWTLGLLAEHPDALTRIAEESDQVIGGRRASMSDVARLEYTRAVVDEALRLYPPAWLVTRRALASDVLGGVDVPAGALIIMSPWLLHRHPDRWREPQAFSPERFLDPAVDRSALIPFGAGPRQCIGRDFAYLEAVLMLAGIAGRVRVVPIAGRALPMAEPLVTLRPRGGMLLRMFPAGG